ncbi:hypothetical protein B0H17DRAFT_1027561 [Mycena rosella]|uniref:Uncharacterized protein n=1 Tax=Mycena rosella TaxID=1033263 RepID=A0AAD7MCG9_MYCRO|nr:hypothetical protein B0H17DRAFT_1027561 [Mycena rosella]
MFNTLAGFILLYIALFFGASLLLGYEVLAREGLQRAFANCDHPRMLDFSSSRQDRVRCLLLATSMRLAQRNHTSHQHGASPYRSGASKSLSSCLRKLNLVNEPTCLRDGSEASCGRSDEHQSCFIISPELRKQVKKKLETTRRMVFWIHAYIFGTSMDCGRSSGGRGGVLCRISPQRHPRVVRKYSVDRIAL